MSNLFCKKSGYYVIVKKPDEIKDPATATLKPPFFLVTSPRGQGVYAGAYGTQPGQDVTIAQSYFSNRIISNLPISGCGNSVRAQKFFDPQSVILAQKGNL